MTEEQVRTSLTEGEVPAHLHDGIVRYVCQGIRPGGFLTSIIEGDIERAILRADETCRPSFNKITSWFYTEAPLECCGSSDIMAAWLASKASDRKEKSVEV